jgi:hypothetical protein
MTDEGKTRIIGLPSYIKTSHYFTLRDNTRYHVSMMDGVTNESIQAVKSKCWWCRHDFDTLPIGRPLRYVPDQMQTHYQSELTKERFMVQQYVPFDLDGKVADPIGSTTHKLLGGYYETDGVYCSFNCCMAAINELPDAPAASVSRDLLMRMFFETHGQAEEITPSPHWRLLEDFGGFMSIDQFRKSLDNYRFIDKHYTMRYVPREITQKPVGHVFEEQFIF